MKKLLSMLLVLSLVLALFAGCATKEEPMEEKETATETKEETKEDTKEEVKEEEEKTEEMEETTPFIVGLVTDTGGIDDKSFNQSTWEGIERFAADNGTETKYLQSDSDADYIPNLSTFSDEELDLIVAAGFLFEHSITEVSTNFPDQKYLLIDMVVTNPNVASAVFSANEGSFLAGVAAALKTEEAGKDKVGYIGGMSFDLIFNFEAGFEAGVKAVNPEIEIMQAYAENFADTQIGQTLAAKMYDDGAYVIYHAAGLTGNGLIKEAKDRRANGEDVWAIGVDKDQYAAGLADDGTSAVLTSMMKRVDVAAYDVSEQVMNDEFPGGEVLVYNLSNGGVSLPAENPNLSDEIMAEVKMYEEKVLSGEIVVPLMPTRLGE